MQNVGNLFNADTGALLDPEWVTQAINRQRGTLRLGARFRLVDSQLRRLDVMQRPPDWDEDEEGLFDSSDISPLVLLDAQIQHDSSRPIHRQLSMTMLDPVYDERWSGRTYVPDVIQASAYSSTLTVGFPLNPFLCFCEVARLVECEGVVFEVPRGIFNMAFPGDTIKPGLRTVAWSGLDLTSLVQGHCLSDMVTFQGYIGTNFSGYLGALQDFLAIDSIPISAGGLGLTPTGNDFAGAAIPTRMIPIGSPDFPAYGNLPVGHDLIQNAGSDRLDFANILLNNLAYYPLTTLHKQVTPNTTSLSFVSRPIPLFANGTPTPDWDLSPLPDTSLIAGAISRSFNSQGVGTNNIARVDGTPTVPGMSNQALPITYSAIAINNNVASELSIPNLRGLSGGGRAIPYYENNNSIANQQMAQFLADLRVEQGGQLSEDITIATVDFPLPEDNDIVELNVQDRYGNVIVASDATTPFLLTAWTEPLGMVSGTHMQMTLTRARAI